MKIISLLMIFVMLSSLVIADAMFDVDETEIVGTDLPNFASSLFGNQRMNIHLTLNDDSVTTFGLVTENGVVTQFTNNELNNPTVNVYSSQNVIEGILTSENAVTAFQQALENGGISYNAIGFMNRIRFSFVSVFVRMASWFGSDQQHDARLNEDESNLDSGSSITGSNVAKINDDDLDEGDMEIKVKEEVIGENIEDIIEDNIHVVKLTKDGFSPSKLTIKSGDKVVWENYRMGNYNKAMVLGVRNCRDIKSKVLGPDDSFEYVFNDKGTCTVVDGMMTTVESKVYVR